MGRIRLGINDLHELACRGDNISEKILFNKLLVRFRYVVSQRGWDIDDTEDIVQEALAVISGEYKKIEFKISFSAWAHKVLDLRMLAYSVKKKRNQNRMTQLHNNFSDNSVSSNPLLLSQLQLCLKKIHDANNNHARILNLKYQGYNTEYICKRLNVTQNNLYLMLFRARKWLAYCLDTGEISP